MYAVPRQREEYPCILLLGATPGTNVNRNSSLQRGTPSPDGELGIPLTGNSTFGWEISFSARELLPLVKNVIRLAPSGNLARNPHLGLVVR
eukprot:5323070-Pyramimonas_sp.AAC.1